MYCKNCGKEIAGGAKFCMSCGVSLEDDYADIDSRTKEKEPKKKHRIPIIRIMKPKICIEQIVHLRLT